MRAIVQYAIAACVILLSVFVAFYLFIALVAVVLALWGYLRVRRWWMRQNLSATDVSPAPEPEITIIEGQFVEIEDKRE